jgi:hypothetical protein
MKNASFRILAEGFPNLGDVSRACSAKDKSPRTSFINETSHEKEKLLNVDGSDTFVSRSESAEEEDSKAFSILTERELYGGFSSIYETNIFCRGCQEFRKFILSIVFLQRTFYPLPPLVIYIMGNVSAFSISLSSPPLC